jgi:hypothetical protein
VTQAEIETIGSLLQHLRTSAENLYDVKLSELTSTYQSMVPSILNIPDTSFRDSLIETMARSSLEDYRESLSRLQKDQERFLKALENSLSGQDVEHALAPIPTAISIAQALSETARVANSLLHFSHELSLRDTGSIRFSQGSAQSKETGHTVHRVSGNCYEHNFSARFLTYHWTIVTQCPAGTS